MKNINFVNTLSHKQQYALRRWWFLSVVLGIGILLVMSILHGLQVHHWYVLTAEYTVLAQQTQALRGTVQARELLSKEQKMLQQKKVKADRVKQSLALVHTRISQITAACATAQLETCKWHKNQVELVIGCKDAMAATQCVGQLQKINGLNTIRLVSLSPRENGAVLATMKAQLGSL